MIAPFLLAWASKPGPAKLLAEVRRRLEQRRLGARSRIELPLTGDERRQVGAMLDAVWAAGDEPVSVSRLRLGLAQHDAELEELLVAVGGPLRDLPAELQGRRAEQEADREQARGILHDLDPRVPDVVALRCLTSVNIVGRARAIRDVVTSITGEDERLPVLAARLFRDAHALDRSQPLGRAVARFLSGADCEVDEDGLVTWHDPVGDAEAWRSAWASRGIVCDQVSAQVLVLNLPLVGDAPAARLAGTPGEPVWLTLRSLRGRVGLASGVKEVFVCENPSIVEAAADRLGEGSRPLVCTFGVPSQAAWVLLRALTEQATLRVRADEDAVGRRIASALLRLPGAQPWRLDSVSVRYEEELVDELLADLASRGLRAEDA